jgi:lysyl-tRNA synthetase, class II
MAIEVPETTRAAVQLPDAGKRSPFGCTRQAVVGRWLAALATVLAGVLSLVSALTPDVPWRRELLLRVEPGSAMGLGHVLAAACGIGLLLLGWGLLRGRRRAADIAIGVLLAVALIHAAKGLDYEESGVALALAGLLYANRSAFKRGGATRPSVLAATVAVAAVAAAYALDTLALLVGGRAASLGAALDQAATTLANGAWWLRSGEPLAIALDLLLVLTLVAAAQALRALMRPAGTADGHSEVDHRRAADIVARYGSDSLDPFALREDKAFFFAYGGLLAYRTLRETAVVSGDPVGPPGTARAIVADFLAYAADRGWDVVVTAASPRFLHDYRALGLHALRVGEEAVVSPQRFSLDGRSIRKVRQSVNRVGRRGWRVEVVEGLGPDTRLAAELAEVERAWQGGRPRLYGFAMTLGRLWGAPEDSRDVVYALGRDPDGMLRAFIRFVGCGDALSLDVMRRSGGEPNGLNEALIVAALGYARDQGVAEMSLNFAGFAHIMSAEASLSRSQRLLRALLKRVHGRFQLERLVRFNEKFEPTWRPRYLIYGDRTHLPIAALRVLQAETYLRPPRSRPLKHRWQPLPHPVEHAVLLSPPETSR